MFIHNNRRNRNLYSTLGDTTNGKGDRVSIRYILFLAVGIWQTYIPAKPEDNVYARNVLEPSGSMICRRNILALGSILVIAGLADVDPRDLPVFGLTLSTGNGVYVLGAAAFLAQLYWYAMRYLHLTAEGKVPELDARSPRSSGTWPIAAGMRLGRKPSDLLANWLAFILTLLSWYFLARWICCLDT